MRKRAFAGMGVLLTACLVTAGVHARAAGGAVSDEAGATQSTDAPAASDTVSFGTTINVSPPIGPMGPSGGTWSAASVTCQFASDPGEANVNEAGPCTMPSMNGTFSVNTWPQVMVTGTATITGPESTVTVNFTATAINLLTWVITGSVTADSATDPDTSGAVNGNLSCTLTSPGPTPGSIAQLACGGSLSIGEGPMS